MPGLVVESSYAAPVSGGIVRTGIITGVITATATLLGVWFTQRHARMMRLLELSEERRLEQRDAVVEVLVTGCEWAAMMLALAQNARHYGGEVSPETATQHRVLAVAHQRALQLAELVARDQQVLACVHSLVKLINSDGMTASLMAVSGASEGHIEEETLTDVRTRVSTYADTLSRLQQLTRERLVDARPNDGRRGVDQAERG